MSMINIRFSSYLLLNSTEQSDGIAPLVDDGKACCIAKVSGRMGFAYIQRKSAPAECHPSKDRLRGSLGVYSRV